MAKIVKKKIRWSAVAEDVVSYKVYFAKSGEVLDYNSPFKATDKLELNVPDDIPELANYDGQVSVGVVAVDEVGNESDMRQADFFSDFLPPSAPVTVEVVDL